MEQKQQIEETRFRVYPLWSLIYCFVFSIQLGIYDVLVAIIKEPKNIFSWYILVLLIWIVPVYAYFGNYISLSKQGIKRVYWGLPFWSSDYEFSKLIKVENGLGALNGKGALLTMILEFDDGKKINVHPSACSIFKNNVPKLQYANFLQVLNYYKNNIVFESAKNNQLAEALSSHKIVALYIMFIIVLLAIGISVNNKLMQIYFEWGWTYSFVLTGMFSFFIYKLEKIDKRPLDNGVYSTLIGAALGLLANILLHLYVVSMIEPIKTTYKVEKINSYNLVWQDSAGKVPAITREGYHIAKSDFDKYKTKSVDVDVYYGPFGLVMMDIEQSRALEVD